MSIIRRIFSSNQVKGQYPLATPPPKPKDSKIQQIVKNIVRFTGVKKLRDFIFKKTPSNSATADKVKRTTQFPSKEESRFATHFEQRDKIQEKLNQYKAGNLTKEELDNELKFVQRMKTDCQNLLKSGAAPQDEMFNLRQLVDDFQKLENEIQTAQPSTSRMEESSVMALMKQNQGGIRHPQGAIPARTDITTPRYDVQAAQQRFSMKADKTITKKAVAEAHIAARTAEEDCAPSRSGDGNSWKALRIDTKGNVTENAVCPTAERSLGISGNLNNVYIHYGSDGQISISCGVIQTKDQADQFMKAVGYALDHYPENLDPPKLRITMHQLNAFGREKKLIKNQNRMASYINAKLPKRLNRTDVKGPFVAHTNRCLNGFSKFPGEAAKSHQNNIVGRAIQAGWILEDFGELMPPEDELAIALTNTSETAREIESLSGQILDIEHSVEEDPEYQALLNESAEKQFQLDALVKGEEGEQKPLEGELKKIDKQIREKRKTLFKNLPAEQKENLEILNQKLSNQKKNLKKMLPKLSKQIDTKLEEWKGNPLQRGIQFNQTLELFNRSLAEQTGMNKTLGYPKLSTAQNLALEMLTDRALGCMSEINCKSGLDRTGFARSLQNALQQKIDEKTKELGNREDALEKVMEFVIGFEDQVKMMDQTAKAGKDLHNFQEIGNFQAKVFDELAQVALPITARSTGLYGLKWNHDAINPLAKNMHPMPYLPSSIQDSRTDKPVKIVTHSILGNRELTQEGHAVLMGLSQKRGA